MSGLEDDAWNPRGWSVRHGCRHRLEKPKRGRAAIVAEIQGQGKEVLRGRSAFKRSTNTGSRRCYSPEYCGKYGCDFLSQVRRKKLRKATLQDAWEALETLEEDQSSVTLEEELDEEELFEEPWQFLSEADADWPDDDGVSSTQSTEASAQDPPKHSDAGKEACKSSRWDLALEKAKVAASVYDLHLKENGPPMLYSPVVVERKRKLHLRARTGKPNTLERHLLKSYNTHLVCSTRSSISSNNNSSRTRRTTEKLEAKKASEMATNFEQFCRRFIDEHGKQVCQGLQRCFQGPIMLQIAPLGAMAQQRFMDACSGPLEGTLRPTFHGTAARNLESIYKHGLMVPGNGNTLRVANGSAHGVGIYTANVRNPSLSWGFCRDGETLLVCGVLDDAKCMKKVDSMGCLRVVGQSDDVLHVGNAVVIFNNERVAPLFVASRHVRDCFFNTVLPLRRRRRSHAGPQSRLKGRVAGNTVEAFLLRRGAQRRRA